MDKESTSHSHIGIEAAAPIQKAKRIESTTLKLTVEELRLLSALASDQLFRRQFIDPKMPGYKKNPEEMSLGKALVARLQLMVDEGNPKKAPAATG